MSQPASHTTNYFDTFIQVADDCPATSGEVPPLRGAQRSMANIQYDMVKRNPYKYTSDEVLFQCYATRNNLADSEWAKAREVFFSKGQACFRSSPLTKRYGWGVHSDAQGRIALYSVDSKDYQRLSNEKSLCVVKAMRSKKA